MPTRHGLVGAYVSTLIKVSLHTRWHDFVKAVHLGAEFLCTKKSEALIMLNSLLYIKLQEYITEKDFMVE